MTPLVPADLPSLEVFEAIRDELRARVIAHKVARRVAVGDRVTLWQPDHGGHVGFPGGSFPGHLMTLPHGVLAWMRTATG